MNSIPSRFQMNMRASLGNSNFAKRKLMARASGASITVRQTDCPPCSCQCPSANVMSTSNSSPNRHGADLTASVTSSAARNASKSIPGMRCTGTPTKTEASSHCGVPPWATWATNWLDKNKQERSMSPAENSFRMVSVITGRCKIESLHPERTPGTKKNPQRRLGILNEVFERLVLGAGSFPARS